MLFLRRALLAWTFLALLSAAPAAMAQKTRYTNRVNERFATISSGPQSALIVDVSAKATDAQIRDAVSRQARAEFAAKGQSLAAAVSRWQAAGLLKSNQTLPLSGVVMVRKDGQLVAPPITRGRQVGGGTLTFRYTGFNDTDRTLLEGFVSLVLPRVTALYGAPARSAEVEVVNAGNLFTSTIPEVRRFAYGIYDASNNRIMLPIFQDPRGTLQAMLLNILHAYHGPAVFQYDAWEQGFARAAAAVILRDPIFNERYGLDDPSANFLYSLLSYYDIMNQAPLGNSTFFPPSQQNIPLDGQFTVAKMLWARIGMSGAAWLKVYIENQNFFNQFNAAYYAQFDPANPGLAGNIPALKAIAAGALSNGVEGLSWEDWYSRQFVLDTSISQGSKLYAFVLPGDPNSEGRQTAAATLVYYRTESSGDETLLGGQAYATYTDGSNSRLSLGPQAERTTITDGEGPLTVTTTNSQGSDATRLTMDFVVNNVTARTYIPLGFTGDFQGALLLNASARSASATQVSLPPIQTYTGSGNVEGTAFGFSMATPANNLGVTTVEVSDGTNVRRWRINTGDGRYWAILRDGTRGGGVVTLTKTFDTAALPYLITLPLRPLNPSPSQALGLNPSDFLVTYWNPLSVVYDTAPTGVGSAASLTTGRGYWFKAAPQSFAPQVTVTVTGIPPATDSDFLVPCAFGWNMVGSPFDQPIELSRVLVKNLQNEPISWDDAVSQNLVAAQPFAFDRVIGDYGQVTGFAGNWNGYWVRVFAPSGVTIILPGPDTPTRAAATRSRKAGDSVNRPDWSVRLFARQDDATRTAAATFGVARGATRAFDTRYDTELPPAIAPGITMEFAPTAGTQFAGGRMVSDFRDAASIAKEAWGLRITPTTTGQVTLNWDGIGNLPRRTDLVLVDSGNGQRTPLRSRSTYAFRGQAGITRQFTIEVQTGVSLPLQVTSFTSVPTRSTGGMTFAGTVTRDSQVTVEITTVNGKSMRRLSGGRAQASNGFRISWDGRSQAGSPLPPGPYAVTLTAETDSGERTQVRSVITLLR